MSEASAGVDPRCSPPLQPIVSEVCHTGALTGIPEPRRTPKRIQQAVRAVLGDATYRQQAERLQRRLGELPGFDHAVGLLEQLAADKQPLIGVGDPG